jgi:hypothetical protein
MVLLQFSVLPLYLTYGVLSITIIPATLHLPKKYHTISSPASSDLELFLQSYPGISSNRSDAVDNAKLLTPGLNGEPILNASGIFPLRDSFVRSAIHAWTQNQHFVIRPEHVWFTILGQLNFFLSNHQENAEVREKIEYQKKINFDIRNYWPYSNLSTFNASRIVDQETRGRFKLNWTHSWLQPGFSTSKRFEDSILATLLFTGPINSSQVNDPIPDHMLEPLPGTPRPSTCGMPSITLLGTRDDWHRLFQKLEPFHFFGSQPGDYSRTLRPILSRFVRSFDEPSGPEIRGFWDATVTNKDSSESKAEGCLEESVISGWISGLHYWDEYGRMLSRSRGERGFTLDGIVYPPRNTSDMPHAYTRTPIRSRTSFIAGYLYTRLGDLMAGMVGKKITSGQPEGYAAAMQRINLTIPSTISEERQSILEPFSRWILIYQLSTCPGSSSSWEEFQRCLGPG